METLKSVFLKAFCAINKNNGTKTAPVKTNSTFFLMSNAIGGLNFLNKLVLIKLASNHSKQKRKNLKTVRGCPQR